jgi:hypothetical protein
LKSKPFDISKEKWDSYVNNTLIKAAEFQKEDCMKMKKVFGIDWYVDDDLIPSDIAFVYDREKIQIIHNIDTGEKKLVLKK